MVTMYNEKKIITLREIIEKTSDSFKFIQKFEYGDFDNWKVALLDSIDIPLNYFHEREEIVGDLKSKYYSFTLRCLYRDVDDVNKYGFDNAKTYPAYDSAYDLITIEDLLNKKVGVVGEWKKD